MQASEQIPINTWGNGQKTINRHFWPIGPATSIPDKYKINIRKRLTPKTCARLKHELGFKVPKKWEVTKE